MASTDLWPNLALSDGTSVHIRPIEVTDAASFLAHRERTYTETPFMAFLPGESTLTVEQEEGIIRNISASSRHAILVATLNGEVVGFAGLSPAFSGTKAAHRANLAVSVERAYWGQGVGTALMRAVITWALQAGYEQLELGVYAENTRARQLYQKLGFVEWGVLPCAMRHPDGSYHDEVHMVLALPRA